MQFFRKKKKALILDDDASMRRLIRRILEKQKFAVDEATTGSQAISLLDKTDYAIVCLDLMMPSEGGMTVMRHLREKKSPHLARVVVVSAAPPSVVDSFAADVFAVVRKPFDIAEFSDVLSRVP